MVAEQKQITDRNVEPLEFMRFLNDAAVRLYVPMNTNYMIDDGEDGVKATWHDAMYDVVDTLEEHAAGRFWCGLGREDDKHFSENFCEIAVYLENPADADVLREHFTVTGAI